jgi:glycosyltransferase involved in cell wall biosynthesis
LRSLRAGGEECELIVVENGPATASVRQVAETFRADYVHEAVLGACRARNQGLRRASGEVVAFIDDDAIAETNWISAIAREFRDPSVAAVSGRIASRSNDPADERLWESAGGTPGGPVHLRMDTRMPDWFSRILLGHIGANGSNLAFRRGPFKGFDARIGPGRPISGGEENVALLQIAVDGGLLVYSPDAIVYHDYPRTIEELRPRYLTASANTAAVLLLVFMEVPRLRGEALRLVWRLVRPRSSGARSVPEGGVVARGRALLWALRGIGRYFRTAVLPLR